MSKKSKSIKTKVIIGYVLLFGVGVISIAFLYNEILKSGRPQSEISFRNKQLIDLSDALTKLYTAETTEGTTSFLSSKTNFSNYNKLIDSVIHKMQNLKRDESRIQNTRLDSIVLLLTQKKNHIAQIQKLNQQYTNESSFKTLRIKLQEIRDSLRNSTHKVDLSKSRRGIVRELGDYFSFVVENEKLVDSISRAPVSEGELLAHSDKVITELIAREDKLKNELRERENILRVKNRELSGKIQILLSSIEKEILDNSYNDILKNQKDIERTTLFLSWAGVVATILLLFFGWIILRDLTRQQKYRDKLEELNRENTLLLRSKTMLIATVTHDLQTPLSSILGFSDLLKKTSLDPTQTQYVNNISSSSDYILNLVNDLVDFSKLENNKIKIKKIAFNPKELIESTFSTLKRNASDKDIALLYQVEDSLDTDIISDPYRVKQILTNLVTNAIKFTQKGHVKISGKITNGNVIFVVEDTGIGITEEQQKLIFEEFTQAHPDIEQQFGGTGLGLTISKRLATLLEGQIEVKSQPEQGSTFTFSIPFIKDGNENKKEGNIEINTEFLKGKKILIVDDDKMQLSLMEALFSNYPIELITENDATKVVRLIESNKFDLILTDIQMPKKSGFVLIQRIRNHKSAAINTLPVIALSGKRDLSEEDFTEKGFTYFLGKPLKMDEALQVMKAVFEKTKIEILPQSNFKKEQVSSDKLYDLNPLKQFISDDSEALKNIISIFLESTKTNLKELKNNSMDLEKLSQIAHKMIPMLRQIESNQAVVLLEKLESKEIPLNKVEKHIEECVKVLNGVMQVLEKEIKGA